MANELDTSKIDGLIEVGMSDATIGASKLDGLVMIGASDATLIVSKIDAFIMTGPSTAVSAGAIRVDMGVF